jgi:hypothetical protein
VAQERHDAEDRPAGHLAKEAEGVQHCQLQLVRYSPHKQTAGRWSGRQDPVQTGRQAGGQVGRF